MYKYLCVCICGNYYFYITDKENKILIQRCEPKQNRTDVFCFRNMEKDQTNSENENATTTIKTSEELPDINSPDQNMKKDEKNIKVFLPDGYPW